MQMMGYWMLSKKEEGIYIFYEIWELILDCIYYFKYGFIGRFLRGIIIYMEEEEFIWRGEILNIFRFDYYIFIKLMINWANYI